MSTLLAIISIIVISLLLAPFVIFFAAKYFGWVISKLEEKMGMLA